MKPKPNKKQLAQMKALNDLGIAPTAIGKRLGFSHHTVIKYLNSDVFSNDPELQRLVEIVKEREVSDLYLLGAKARKRLHELLDEGKMKAIETTAVLDRTFQQRRLLEGQATVRVDYASLSRELEKIRAEREKLEAEIAALEADTIDITPSEGEDGEGLEGEGSHTG